MRWRNLQDCTTTILQCQVRTSTDKEMFNVYEGETTRMVLSRSDNLTKHSQLPLFGGIKRPHVEYDCAVDTCGFTPASVGTDEAGGASCRLAQKRILSNNTSLSRSLRFVPTRYSFQRFWFQLSHYAPFAPSFRRNCHLF